MKPHQYPLYFIAIVPPSPIREELQSYKEIFKNEFGSKASLNSPPHITLHMPFRFSPKKEGKLLYHLEKVAGEVEPFEIQLNGFGAFGPRVIYVDVEANAALTELQHKVMLSCRQDLKLMNANYRNQAFHPHVTLAFRDLKKRAFAEAWARYKNTTYEATFKVNEILLLRHDGKMWQSYKSFELAEKP